MNDENNGADYGTEFRAAMGSRGQKLKIWAIRSVIVLIVGGLIAWRGPDWVLWLAIAYVVVTLGTAFWLTRNQ